jgi:hypothetical protein
MGADKDPTAVLERFTQQDADTVLFIACNEFGRVAKGQPVELQVYAAWWLAIYYQRVSDAPLSKQQLLRNSRKLFPGIRSANRAEQERLGREQLEKARLNPNLQMMIQREVVLR